MGWAILKRFAFQRITPNVNNPHYIRGGRRRPDVCPTIVSQPAPIIYATFGAPFSYDFSQHFGGAGASRRFYLAGVLPPWASFSATTGIYSGTPTATTTTTCTVRAEQDGCATITLSNCQVVVQ